MQPAHHHREGSSRLAAVSFPATSKTGRSLGARACELALILSLVISVLLGPAVPLASAAVPRENEVASPAGAPAPARIAAPVAPGVSVSKTVVSPVGRNVFYTGETVTFQVAVTNTGTTTVAFLPQDDEYGTECLRFIPKADPPESFEGPGLIQWYDLTFDKGMDLAPGAVFTTSVKFLVVGPPTGQSANGYNTGRVTGALDANNSPVPDAESTVNFTCSQRPSVAVDKSFVTPQNRTVLLTGETITFKAVVTNTGPTTLGFIPQLDLYDTSCLTFLPKASPAESSGGAGLIQWYDLTFDNGRDLPPGQAFTTTMNFKVTGPTSGTTQAGTNEVQVSGALDVFGSPAPSAQDIVQYTCAAPASIGDYVWLDVNGNGLQDEGPGAGINGVTLYLYKDDGDGVFEPGTQDVLVATDVTSGDGGYLFDMLHAGSYWVDVDQTTVPAGLTLTSGTDPKLVTVNYGDAYLLADYGYRGAGIAINKIDSSDPVLAGGTLKYTLFVNNSGPADALNVVVTDTLPAAVTFISSTPNRDSGPNPLVWNLGTIPAGGSQTIVVTTTVSATASGTIYNRAEVHTSTPDPNPADNTDVEPTLVVSPAVQIVKTADPTVVLAGGTVVYSYEVTNPGDVPLAGVTVTDDKCSPVSYVSGDGNGNGLLDPGEVWRYTCTTTVSVDTTNTGKVVGQPSDPSGQPLSGIGPVEDTDPAFVDVVAPAIKIVKVADPATIYPGEAVVYTFTVTNAGDVPLGNVTVSDDHCSPVVYVSGDANTNGRLDLTETWVYTCTGYPTADTVNVASVVGQPSDPNGQPLPGIGPVRDEDTASVNVIRPAIQVVKVPSATQVPPGTPVTYTYQVTNPGDDPLSNVTVSDDKCAPVTGPAAGGDANSNGKLDPGETWVYTCTTTLSVDTVNTALATGTDSLGSPVRDDDTAFVDVVTVGLQIDKAANPTTVYAGGSVTYSYTVRNTGGNPISNVVVTDDKCSPVVYVSGDTNGNGKLDPAEVWQYTCTTTLTEDTTNVATVTGVDQLGRPVPPDEAVADVNVIVPAIRVVKTADKTVVLSGTAVQYTYEVTNPGDDPLSNVTVTDDKCSPLTGPAAGGDANGNGKLDPGETWTYTCTATITADTTNTATAIGTDSLGNPVRDTDTETVDVVKPAVQIVKTADPTVVLAGGTVVYSYEVTNPGDVPLAGVTVTDDKCSPVSYVSGDGNANGLLDPGEVWQYTCTTTVSVDTTNTGTVVGQPSDPNGQPLPGIGPVEDTDPADVDVVRPGIKIVKVADPAVIYPGEAVVYTFTVTNTGDVPLGNVTVSDDHCSPVVYVSGDANTNGLLDLTETWVYTCTGHPTADTVNVASVVGQPSDPNGQPLPGIGPVRDDDTASVNVINPAIHIVKTADPTEMAPGGTVVYTYAVTNPGDDPLANVTVSDDKCAPVTGPAAGGDANSNGKLDPGETWVYTCTTTLSVDTVNTATAAGTDSLGSPVRDTDTAFVDVVTVGLQIDKAANPTTVYAGGNVTYSYTVRNTGGNPISNVAVNDDKCSPVTYVSGDTNTDGKLDPAEVWTYTCTTTLTEDTTNVATVTGVDQLGRPVPPDEAVADVNVIKPAINVVKVADPTVVLSGTAVQYTYVVTNPGDDPLSNVTVTDDKCSPLSFTGGDNNLNGKLDPGETWTYTCVAMITQDTTNTVTAVGDGSLGSPASDTDTATVDVVKPAINVVKVADPTVILPGGAVQYTYLVSNSGDVPLGPVTVTDNTCSPVTGPAPSGDVNGNGLLDPGETWVYTCVAAVGQDTTNIATTVGQPSDPNGQPLPGIPPVEDTDTATVDVVHPAIRIVKSAAPTTVYPGELVNYTFMVTNPGDVPLANVTVTDDKCSPVVYQGGDTNGNGLLDLSETWVYRCTAAVSVDTLNTAVAIGRPTDPNGQPLPGLGPVRDEDTATVDVIRPAIRVVKVPSATQVPPGTLVTYTYQVTNIGDASLSSVVVADNKCSPVVLLTSDGNGLLDPGETWLFECKVVLNDDTANTATVTARDPLGGPVQDTDQAFVDVLKPGLQVDKSASATVVYAGTVVTYTYTVRNTGTDPVYNVTVTDDKCSPVTYVGGDANGNNRLDPSEVWTYRCTATIGQDTVNVATATGQDALGNPVSDGAAATVDVIHPAIQVVKVADPVVVLPGGQVQYTYRVTNPGDDPLSNVTVTDDKCSPVQYQGGDANANGKLDPGEVWTYRCVGAPTADTTNTATAAGNDSLGKPVQDTDTATVDVVRPGINVTKTADPVVVLPGGAVVYTYQVSNAGDVPLAGVTVTDDKCSPVTYTGGDANSNGLLDVGEVWTYTCTTTVSQDTTNTATTVGQPSDPNGQPLPGIPPVNDQASATVNVVNPRINVEKTAVPATIYANGSVTYVYVVTNPGDVPLANVSVTDDKCSPLVYQSGDANGNNRLDPGEAWLYTCTTTVAVDTLNTAVAVGQPTDPNGQPLPGIGPVRDEDTATVDVIRPAIRVVKVPSATQVPPGTLVTYTYQVTNVGDASLSSVVVADNKCSPVVLLTSDGNGLLDPGETWLFECQAVLNDDTANTATVTARDPLGGPVQDTDQAFVDVLKPGLQVDKVADRQFGYQGQAVLYTYTVRNTGTDPVYNVAVTDNKCSPVTYVGGDANGNNRLDPGEVWTYQCSTTLTDDVTNIATATGRDALGNPVPPDQASATVDVIHPAIQVVKVADPVVVVPGGQVQYTYRVTNPGDDPLSNVTVTDDKCSPVLYQAGDENANGKLEPGEVWTYTCVGAPTADTTNTATAAGDDSLGNPVRDTDTATVDVVQPGISVVKTADPVVILAGGTVVYTYQVRSTGDVPLGGVNVSDDTCAPVQYQSGDTNINGLLNTGEVWIFTCTTTVSQDTINTATAIGQPADPNGFPLPGINPVNGQDTATVDVVNPRINVEKTANPATIHAGDSVTYNYVVTNPGDVPLANVSVTDDKCSPLVPTGGDTNGNNRLDPGEAWLYTCTTTLAADTLNTVTATGQPTGPSGQPLPGIGPVTDQATALVDVINPAIHVIKSGPATSFKGDTAVFTYAVTNAGDTPLSGVTVTDNVCGAATYLYGDANLDGKLGLGELWVFRCSYVVQPGDPDPLVNTATATGADALGRQVTDQDTWRTDLFTVRFGDFVWLDDGDGVQQPGETTGIAGVKIHVTGLDVLGNTIDITVTTSITGFYMVSNLVPGTYTATVPAVVSTYHLSSVGTRTFTLSQAVQQRLDIDFGYTLPTGLQLLAFDAVPDAASVQLSWEVMLGAGVTEPPQFHVWRSDAGGAWKQLTEDYLAPTAQDGVRATYAFTDVQVEPGRTYLYQLKSADGETFGPRQATVPADHGKVYLPLITR